MAGTTAQKLDNQTADRFFQSGTALNRVLTEAPYLPRCSDDKTATRVRPREYAIRYPYMQVNRPGFVSWLIFDLDHTKAMIWEDAGLPAPNLIVRNRQSGHSHLYYAIPGLHDRGRPQQAHRVHEGRLRGLRCPARCRHRLPQRPRGQDARPSLVADARAARPHL